MVRLVDAVLHIALSLSLQFLIEALSKNTQKVQKNAFIQTRQKANFQGNPFSELRAIRKQIAQHCMGVNQRF